MKYIKIKGDLLKVLGESIRKPLTIGIELLPQHQMIDKDKTVSYGTILDENKFNIEHEAITYFETVEELNADIDAEYDIIYILKDVNELTLDIQLSGNPEIVGYNKDLALTSQENLKALYDANMGGIVLNKKAEYFVE